jgi:cytochrome P450
MAMAVESNGLPSECVIDLDHHTTDFNLNEVAVTSELRRKCPVAWNQQYGGFWFVTGYSAVEQIARDARTFAHRYERHAADGIDYYGEGGIPRDEGLPALGIGEVDGPYHFALRRALNPFFTPQAVASLRPFMEGCVDWFIDQKIRSGEMDLVLDYASPIPAIMTMKMLGLPYGDWALWAELFHTAVAYPVGHEAQVRATEALPQMLGALVEFAEQRRAHPTEDLTSFLVQLEIDGEPLKEQQIIDIFMNLIAGGVDTTGSLTAWSLYHMGARPALRDQLRDNPDLYATATDEFVRYTTVNQMLSRTVTEDVEVGGQLMRKNDRVLISWLGANFDESEFSEPEEIVLNRSPNRHLAFGLGPHRCIGSHLARSMFEVMVRGVLDRIPDYEVDLDVDQYLGNPTMTGIVKMPARFTPGEPVGATPPF